MGVAEILQVGGEGRAELHSEMPSSMAKPCRTTIATDAHLRQAAGVRVSKVTIRRVGD